MVFDGIRQGPGEKCVCCDHPLRVKVLDLHSIPVRHPPSFAMTTVKTVSRTAKIPGERSPGQRGATVGNPYKAAVTTLLPGTLQIVKL